MEAAARRAASVLDDAGDAAPNRPGFLHRALHFAGEVVGGAVEATAGMATFAFKLTPVYELIDPEGYVENLTGLGKGLIFGATHPVAFAKAIVDWDTWAESPGRAIGHLLPTIALAAATAGAGAGAEAGVAGKATLAAGTEATEVRIGAQAAVATQETITRDLIVLTADESWGNPTTLLRHFRDHGADFGAVSAQDYAKQASEFLQYAQKNRLPTRIDPDGVIRIYDPESNTFGAYNPAGGTRTFFKPTSSTYWDRQLGSPPWPR